jgi:pilus assembly protein CpaC
LFVAACAAAVHGQAPAGSLPGLPMQTPVPAPVTAAPQAPLDSITQPPVPRITLTAGRSLVISTDFDMTRISLTNDAIANATPVNLREILIDGKAPGTVSLIIWGDTQRLQYDVVVDPGVSTLQRQLQLIFPNEDIQASESADLVILTGHASANAVMLNAQQIAEAAAPKARVINMLQLPGGNGSQQVMLEVRIAEVNRRALTEAGTSLFTGATGFKDFIMRGTTQQFPAPNFDNLKREAVGDQLTSSSGDITFSDFLNLFVFSNKYNVGTLIKALRTTGHFQSLAEPNLIAYNGVDATFLAGGELPIPVVQGTSGQVSVTYKEFGVRLTFRPTIAGDVIRLKVKPEVSALDFANGITIEGFRIPALTTRRAETDVELRDGQSFAIAGLMNNAAQDTKQAIPVLSRIPLIGNLFKSKSTNQERTELLVLVTPHLVRALNPDEVPPLPTLPGKFLLPCDKPPCPEEKKKGGGGGEDTPPPAATTGPKIIKSSGG